MSSAKWMARWARLAGGSQSRWMTRIASNASWTPPDKEAWNNQMYKIRVFDNLVYDTDPNLTNVLIGEDWKLWRIDFSRGFRTFKDVKDPKDLVRCDRQLFEKLKALNATDLTEKTKGYLTKDEVKGVMARRDKVIEYFQKINAQKGRDEDPY